MSRTGRSGTTQPRPDSGLVHAAVVLGVGLLVIEGLALLIGYLVVGHHGGGVIQSWDNTVEKWWITHRDHLVDTSKVMATLGNPLDLGAISVLLSILLVATTRRFYGLAPLFAYAGAELMVLFTRELIARPRPATANFPARDAIKGIHQTSYSFPSDHATAAVAVLVSLFGVLCIALRLWSPWLLGLIAGAAVATSRLLLGVNWFSDVAFGMVFGVAWAIVVTAGLRNVALSTWPFRLHVNEVAPPGTGRNAWPGNRAAGGDWPRYGDSTWTDGTWQTRVPPEPEGSDDETPPEGVPVVNGAAEELALTGPAVGGPAVGGPAVGGPAAGGPAGPAASRTAEVERTLRLVAEAAGDGQIGQDTPVPPSPQ